MHLHYVSTGCNNPMKDWNHFFGKTQNGYKEDFESSEYVRQDKIGYNSILVSKLRQSCVLCLSDDK